ncbi:MAG: ABC-ATPase domain-containing protein [Kiritimatiellae bacterium]|nr:ABC-ATPase domain-containing protein [Kiritimatiellia bacterium]
MLDRTDLQRILHAIDGHGYPAYRDIRGSYRFADFTLFVDHVQGDPFAAPSRLRVRVPMPTAGFPREMWASRIRCTALRDFLARAFARACRAASDRLGSGKSGLLAMDVPGQEILERSSIAIEPDWVEARFVAGLPARGRRVLGREAAAMLCDGLPPLVAETLCHRRLDAGRLHAHLRTAEDADALRRQLPEAGLAAFVADGAILPRRSGVDDRPLQGPGVVPFRGPDSLRVELALPNAGRVAGMGIPRGITLIVGGGYHGKSTLLAALERGVYDHVPGDGRERVVTDPTAVKIRAEDGRRIEGVDIRPFIRNLPDNSDTRFFRTENASGSTSQAANILEALEVGARVLLLDEDTCATNLMIRDARMQELVEKAGEPITPLVDRVRQLAERDGVSGILVLGGSGDYFDVADTVIRMHAYRPQDVTARAKAVAEQHPTGRRVEDAGEWPAARTRRYPLADSLDPRKGRRDVSIRARALRAVLYGTEEIDVSFLAQLVDEGQVRAIGKAIELARRRFMTGAGLDMAGVVHAVAAETAEKGLDALDDRPIGDYVAFRPHELAAALNRLRTLRVKEGDGP